MVSIIICSRNKRLLDLLVENIGNSIGVPFETIVIDNNIEKLSLSAAYNKGAQKAKYNYLLFLHEDVFFKTQNWGTLLLNHFLSDPTIGLIGLAGGIYKSPMVSGWWQSEPNYEFRRMNIIQRNTLDSPTSKSILINPNNETQTNVVTLDGVFLATKKSVWMNNKFDENLLRKFHGYDLDFSLQVSQQNRVIVVYDILLEHFSGGKANAEWLIEMLLVHKKWRDELPAFATNYYDTKVTDEQFSNDLRRLRKNIMILIDEKIGFFKTLIFFTNSYSFLDRKANIFSRSLHYMKELSRVIRLYLVRK